MPNPPSDAQETRAPRIRLHLLGRPEARLVGNKGTFPLGKPFAALCFLAVESRAAARSELAALLWPDSDGARARGSVRQALHTLRKWIDQDLVVSGDHVALRPGTLALDVEEFERFITAGQPTRAAGLWEGPFLHGLEVHTRPWDRWVDDTGGRLSKRLAGALEIQAVATLESGSPEDARASVALALPHAPHRGALHRLHIAALIEMGRIEEARAALRAAEQALEGIPGTHRLITELHHLVARPAKGARGGRDEGYGFHLDLVGRAQELGELADVVQSAIDGTFSIASVTGPPGIGKTRLALEVLRRFDGRGAQAARTKCHTAERELPLGVVVDLVHELRGLNGATGVDAASDLVLSAVAPYAGVALLGSGQTPPPTTAIADALLDLVRAVAFEGPLILVIDDIQWIDPDSRSVLARVTRKLDRCGVSILITSRDADAPRDVTGNEGTSIILKPLDRAQVVDLVTRAVQVEPKDQGSSIGSRFYATTRGNPLFVVEVLKRLKNDGVLRHEGDVWRLDAKDLPHPPPVPPHVHDLILQRLERLPIGALQLSRLMADRPGASDPSALRRESRLNESDFRRALSMLLSRGVIEWVGPGVDFAHELLRLAAEDHVAHRRRTRGTKRVALAMGLLVIAAIFLSGVLEAPGRYPYGRGILVIRVDGEIEARRAPARLSGEWNRVSIEAPKIPIIARATRLTTGEVLWTGRVDYPPLTGQTSPDAAEAIGAAEPRVVEMREGDHFAIDASPDGRFALVIGESRTGEDRYSTAAFRVDRRSLIAEAIFDPRHRLGYGGAWSPDGLKIAIGERHGSAEHVIMSPDGQELQRFTNPDGIRTNSAHWCDDSETFGELLTTDTTGVAIAVTPRSGEWEAISPDSIRALESPVCVGSGTAWAFRALRKDGTWDLFLMDQLTRSTRVIPTSGRELDVVAWVPDTAPAVATGLRITGPDREIVAGGAIPLKGVLETHLGDSAVSVQWSSESPLVRTADDGILVALRPGVAWIHASYGPWLQDSIQIEIGETPEAETFLADDFASLDTSSTWLIGGFPRPELISSEGSQVLSHNGDGNSADPMFSSQAFPADAGLVLQVDIQLQLTLMDRQRVRVCLDTGTGYWGEADRIPVHTGGAIVCFQYPVGEGETLRPGFAELIYPGPGLRVPFPVPEGADFGGWTSLALQLDPSGIPTVAIDGEVAQRGPIPVANSTRLPWFVVLDGAADSTHLLFRSFRLSRGVRF